MESLWQDVEETGGGFSLPAVITTSVRTSDLGKKKRYAKHEEGGRDFSFLALAVYFQVPSGMIVCFASLLSTCSLVSTSSLITKKNK